MTSEPSDEIVNPITADVGKLIAHCSFCGKSQRDVSKLVSGPAVFICDECIGLCRKIVEAEADQGTSTDDDEVRAFGATYVEYPTETLLALLGSQNAQLERVRDQLQATVDILRQRQVSWAHIGKALGVSRQAAWERFM